MGYIYLSILWKEIKSDIILTFYRKRLLSGSKAYYTHKEFCSRVDRAGADKLAKMLHILSFLTQTKVYLFWKSHNGSRGR